MLFRSFGHWLLIIFGAFVLTICTFLAAKAGLLGEGARLWAVWAIGEFYGLYLPNKEEIDFGVKAIGAAGTALGAVWTVHKGWHYAERNLPTRIIEINKRYKESTEGERPVAIPQLADHRSIALPFDREPSPLLRLLHWVHSPTEWALANSRRRIDDSENDFRVLTSSRVRCRAQLITAHLEYGARLSRSGRGKDALDAFSKALRLNRTDADSLELSARQAFVQKQSGLACEHLQASMATADRSGDVLRRARAMRFHAEILKGGSPSDQIRARDVLKAAIVNLTSASVADGNARLFELCLAHGQLADVQTVRNTLSSARTALNQANVRFRELDSLSRAETRTWLSELDRRLTQAELDRDRDKERNEDSTGD